MFQGEEEGASPLVSANGTAGREDAEHYKTLSNDTEHTDPQTPRY
jgi:hypothetical protein